MQSVYIELFVDNEGNVTGSKTIAREKIIVRKRKTTSITPQHLDESPSILLLREALARVGGPVALAAKLGVSRSNIYQWIYRNKVTRKAEIKLEEMFHKGDAK